MEARESLQTSIRCRIWILYFASAERDRSLPVNRVTDKSLPETGVTGTLRSDSSNTILSERMPDLSERDGLTGRGKTEIKHE